MPAPFQLYALMIPKENRAYFYVNRPSLYNTCEMTSALCTHEKLNIKKS